jgi:hypothetical protein
MRVDTLPSPGKLSMGINLQNIMSKAISSIELSSSATGKSSQAAQLTVFLNFCVAAIASYIDTTAVTKLSQSINLARPRRITVRFNQALDKNYEPPKTAFTVGSGTIERIMIDGPDIIIILLTALTNTTNTVAYTQPGGVNNLRGENGQLVASFTAAATTAGTL